MKKQVSISMIKGEVDTERGTMKMDFTPASAVVFRLNWIAARIPDPAKAERVSAMADYLQAHLQGLEFLPTKEKRVQIRYTVPERERSRIEGVLAEEVVGRVMAEIAQAIIKSAPPNPRKDRKDQKGLVRIGGHLIDHELKRKRISCTDDVLERGEDAVLENKMLELAKLDFSEKRVLNGIAMLLHQKSSNTTNPESYTDYYTGNLQGERVRYSGEVATAPVLSIRLYELAKLIYGEGVGGGDIGKVRLTLERLASKKYVLHEYYRETRSGHGITAREAMPIFSILRWQQAERHNTEGEVVKRAEVVVLQLSPLFRDQIADKYITYREDFYPRLAKASGKTTEAVHEFMMYLLREVSAGRVKCEITQSRLIVVMMLERVAKQGRAQRLENAISKAIETGKRMNVIARHYIRKGKSEQVFCFELNSKWHTKE